MGGGGRRHIKNYNAVNGTLAGYEYQRSPGVNILYKTDLFKRFLLLPPGEIGPSTDPFDTSIESAAPTLQHCRNSGRGFAPPVAGNAELPNASFVNLGEFNRQLFGNREFTSTDELLNGGKSPAYASLDPRNTIDLDSIDHLDTHDLFKDRKKYSDAATCSDDHVSDKQLYQGDVVNCHRFVLDDGVNPRHAISTVRRPAHIMHLGSTLHQLEDRVMTPDGARHFEDLPEVRELQFRLFHLTASALHYRTGNSGIDIKSPGYSTLGTAFGGDRTDGITDRNEAGGPKIYNFMTQTNEERVKTNQAIHNYTLNSVNGYANIDPADWATVKRSLPGLTSSIHLHLLKEEGNLTKAKDQWMSQYYGTWAHPNYSNRWSGKLGYDRLIDTNPEFSGIPKEHFVNINRDYLKMATQSPEQHVESMARAFGSLWDKFNNGTYKRHPNFWSDHAFSAHQTSSSSWDKINHLLNSHFMGYNPSQIRAVKDNRS